MPRKKIKYIDCAPMSSAPYTAEENESRFNKDYGFNKPVSVRSPLRSGWEDKYIREDSSYAPPKEVVLVKGTPYKNKHRRDGNIYSSRPTRRSKSK